MCSKSSTHSASLYPSLWPRFAASTISFVSGVPSVKQTVRIRQPLSRLPRVVVYAASRPQPTSTMVRMPKANVPAFKTLASKIHPPLPRTKRESQQLLEILTSSFRRQLDQQHPPPEARLPARRSSQSDVRRKHGPATTTDKHLNSLLAHPLFNTDSKNQGNSAPGENGRPHPLAVLADAMAAGKADVQTLYSCLKAHRIMMHSLSDLETRQVMEASRVGATIVSWYAAADLESRGLFFSNRHVMALVMPYMSSLSFQETVMGWLELLSKKNSADTDWSYALFNVLYEFTAAEIRYGGGINSALEAFIRVRSLPSISRRFSAMRPTAYYLVQWISSHEKELRASPIPAELFDRFSTFFKPTNEANLYPPLLALYHPAHPNPDPALQIINLRPANELKDGNFRNRLLRMCFKASEVCLQQERDADARTFLAYARDLLPNEQDSLGASSKTRGREVVSPSELASRLDPSFT